MRTLLCFVILSTVIHVSFMYSFNRIVSKSAMKMASSDDNISYEYDSIKDLSVLRPKSLNPGSVKISSLWGENDRALLVLLRSFG